VSKYAEEREVEKKVTVDSFSRCAISRLSWFNIVRLGWALFGKERERERKRVREKEIG